MDTTVVWPALWWALVIVGWVCAIMWVEMFLSLVVLWTEEVFDARREKRDADFSYVFFDRFLLARGYMYVYALILAFFLFTVVIPVFGDGEE